MLQVASNEPEAYGLKGIDFNDISLCNPIKPYTLNDAGIEEVKDIEYYPLKSGDRIVGNFTVCYDDNNEYSVTFDTRFIKEFNQFLDSNDKVAFIHNDGDLFIKSNEGLRKISSSKEGNLNLNSTNSEDERLIRETNVELENIETFEELAMTSDSKNLLNASYKRIDMPYIAQGNAELCWAAVAASMGVYYTGITKTAKYIANQLGIGYNERGTVYDMQEALSSIYGLSADAGPWTISLGSVMDVIDNNTPIGAAFVGSGSMGHAVVICGYSYGSQGMVGIVRDPNTSSYMMVHEANVTENPTFSIDYYSGGKMYWVNSCMVQ